MESFKSTEYLEQLITAQYTLRPIIKKITAANATTCALTIDEYEYAVWAVEICNQSAQNAKQYHLANTNLIVNNVTLRNLGSDLKIEIDYGTMKQLFELHQELGAIIERIRKEQEGVEDKVEKKVEKAVEGAPSKAKEKPPCFKLCRKKRAESIDEKAEKKKEMGVESKVLSRRPVHEPVQKKRKEKSVESRAPRQKPVEERTQRRTQRHVLKSAPGDLDDVDKDQSLGIFEGEEAPEDTKSEKSWSEDDGDGYKTADEDDAKFDDRRGTKISNSLKAPEASSRSKIEEAGQPSIYIKVECFTGDSRTKDASKSDAHCQHLKVDGEPVTLQIPADCLEEGAKYCIDTKGYDENLIEIVIKRCPECQSTLLASSIKMNELPDESHESVILHNKLANEERYQYESNGSENVLDPTPPASLELTVDPEHLEESKISVHDPAIPLTRKRVCSSMEFDVSTAATRLREDGIEHVNPQVLLEFQRMGVDKILRACRPAKCCRKAILNEKQRDALPYCVSLRSLPLVSADIPVIEQSVDMSLNKRKEAPVVSPDAKSTLAFYIDLGREDFTPNVNFPWVVPVYSLYAQGVGTQLDSGAFLTKCGDTKEVIDLQKFSHMGETLKSPVSKMQKRQSTHLGQGDENLYVGSTCKKPVRCYACYNVEVAGQKSGQSTENDGSSSTISELLPEHVGLKTFNRKQQKKAIALKTEPGRSQRVQKKKQEVEAEAKPEVKRMGALKAEVKNERGQNRNVEGVPEQVETSYNLNSEPDNDFVLVPPAAKQTECKEGTCGKIQCKVPESSTCGSIKPAQEQTVLCPPSVRIDIKRNKNQDIVITTKAAYSCNKKVCKLYKSRRDERKVIGKPGERLEIFINEEKIDLGAHKDRKK